MKVIFIILSLIRWIIGLMLILISFGGLISGDYLIASIVFLIGFLLIPPVINKIFKRDISSSSDLLDFLQNLNLYSSSKMINSLNFNDKSSLLPAINHQILNSKKPITDKRRYNIGKIIYRKALQIALLDLHLSEKEKQHLDDIILNFNLNITDILNIKKSFSEKTVQNLILKSYDDKILTENEKEEIFNLAKYLNLPTDKVESIRMKVASSLLRTALNEKLSDKRLSPSEETELNQILNNLQIEKDLIRSIIPKKSLDELAYAKLLWNLDNGIFYSIPNAPITLRKLEECYLGLALN